MPRAPSARSGCIRLLQLLRRACFVGGRLVDQLKDPVGTQPPKHDRHPPRAIVPAHYEPIQLGEAHAAIGTGIASSQSSASDRRTMIPLAFLSRPRSHFPFSHRCFGI